MCIHVSPRFSTTEPTFYIDKLIPKIAPGLFMNLIAKSNKHIGSKADLVIDFISRSSFNSPIWKSMYIPVYTNCFCDASVIFSNFIITYREPFTGTT